MFHLEAIKSSFGVGVDGFEVITGGVQKGAGG
jgi:hypothetical protein